MSVRRLDGCLALVAITLVAVLIGSSMELVASAISRISGSGQLSSALLGIAVSVGLFVCQMALRRLTTRHSAGTYIALSSVVIAGLSAWHMTQTSHTGTSQWWIGFFFGSILPLQSVLLGSIAGSLLEMAGPSWWCGKRSRSSTLALPEGGDDDVVKSAPHLVLPSTELTLADTAVAHTKEAQPQPALQEEHPVECQPPLPHSALVEDAHPRHANQDLPIEPSGVSVMATPLVLACQGELRPSVARSFSVARVLTQGERVTIKVNGSLSNSRWKDLHQALRRVASISWDDAQKVKSLDGGSRERILSGVFVYPACRGKKHKDAKENARRRHADSVLDRIAQVVAAFDK